MEWYNAWRPKGLRWLARGVFEAASTIQSSAQHAPKDEKETTMKHKATSFFLGLCLATLAVTASRAAEPGATAAERSTNAFSSFHVRVPIDTTQNPYQCLTEQWGALVNNCGYQVSVVFNLPVEHKRVHTVKAQNYVGGTGTSGTVCNVWSYDGNGGGEEGTNLTFNISGAQTLTFTSVLFGNSISLLCDLPSGEGLGAITWNP
jgi:hypothetical protein